MPIIGNNIDEAARRLRNGQPVAFATETVYGLGAAANNRQAMSTMYALKNRPSTHPSIVHLADFADADQWAHVSPTARQLAAAFMPGALTLLLPARTSCIAAAKHDTVALRVPAHPQARALLAAAAIGIAAPSANRFGRLSPTTAAHVCAEFPQEKDLYILDGGNCAIGVESTIVSCLHGQVSLIRPGAIVAKQIAEVAEVALSPPPPHIAAPGTLSTHYAPQKPLILATEMTAATATMAALSRHRPPSIAPTCWRYMSPAAPIVARELYANLRALDATAAESIIVEMPPELPCWTAVRDRLLRAAGRG